MVEGYQGEGSLKEPYKIAACVKHFAGYGAPIAGREYNTVELSTRTLYDNYLPAYQAAIKAGCATAMTSFNTLDRVPSTANKWLMRDVLRKQMGFEGVLISDWAAIEEVICHGVASGKKEAARLALEAGVDIDMMTTCYCRNIKELIEEKQIDISLLDEAVYRILNLKNELGLFENPYKDADKDMEKEVVLSAEHRWEARYAATHTIVLLKNDDAILPLKKEGQKIAFIGPHVESPYLMGGWSIFGEAKDVVTLRQGVENANISEVSFQKGAPIVSVLEKLDLNPAVKADIETDIKNREELLKNAVEAAKESDVVVLALGEHPVQSGEAASKTDLHLDNFQKQLFDEIKAVNENIVTVLFNGRPLILSDIVAESKAIVEAWLPGTEGGNAVTDILFGNVNPSAKLSMSFPINEGQIPVHYSEFNTGRPIQHKQEKYLSQYMDCPNEPLFPFGYGLSYTEFSVSDIELDKRTMHQGESIKASIILKNTGLTEGAEVVQLYIKDEVASVARPKKELKAFQKVFLKPNEEQRVTFEIEESMLKFHDIHMNYVSEAGDFQLFIGKNSTTNNSVQFTLKKEK